MRSKRSSITLACIPIRVDYEGAVRSRVDHGGTARGSVVIVVRVNFRFIQFATSNRIRTESKTPIYEFSFVYESVAALTRNIVFRVHSRIHKRRAS